MYLSEICRRFPKSSVLVFLFAALLPFGHAMAQAGGTINNGTPSAPPGVVIPGFLFEPEFPLDSLKNVPTWSELEQLLDNPYNVALCSSLPTTVDPLVRTTPGTTQITGSPALLAFPAYCTTAAVARRPGFGITLPPFKTHPLNYNATTGEEMRLLNATYPGGSWVVPDQLLQCGSAAANANVSVKALCNTRGNNPNVWLWSYKKVAVTPGAGRVDDAEIDDNGPIRADVTSAAVGARLFAVAATNSNTAVGLLTAHAFLDATCAATTEPFPAPEGAINCGGDPGEPGDETCWARCFRHSESDVPMHTPFRQFPASPRPVRRSPDRAAVRSRRGCSMQGPGRPYSPAWAPMAA